MTALYCEKQQLLARCRRIPDSLERAAHKRARAQCKYCIYAHIAYILLKATYIRECSRARAYTRGFSDIDHAHVVLLRRVRFASLMNSGFSIRIYIYINACIRSAILHDFSARFCRLYFGFRIYRHRDKWFDVFTFFFFLCCVDFFLDYSILV